MGQKMFSSELWNNPGSTQVLTQKAIFGFGQNGGSNTAVTNLVSDSGVVASDTSGVGTVRNDLAASGYGEDKALFGFGDTGNGSNAVSMTNLVSNNGVVASDTTGVGTARSALAAAAYGGDKALFGFGIVRSGGETAHSTTNKVSNSGVVASDTAGVGSARMSLAAAGYAN